MRKLSLVAAALAFVGCAKAGIGPSDDDSSDSDDQSDSDADSTDDSDPSDNTDNTDNTDESVDDSDDSLPIDSAPPIDAPPPDAAPVSITLSQTDSTIANDKGIACGNAASTAENSWYRVYDLAGAGVIGPLSISEVTFGIETSTLPQSIDVKIGTYSGTLNGSTINTAQITPIAAMTVNIGAVNLILQPVPIVATAPANSLVVVEIRAADGEPTGTHFYIGASAAAETQPTYLRGPDCDVLTPTSMKQLNPAAGSAIINVTGTYN
jgi:hypothetical protein